MPQAYTAKPPAPAPPPSSWPITWPLPSEPEPVDWPPELSWPPDPIQPPGWNPIWPLPGAYPPGYEPDFTLSIAAPEVVSTVAVISTSIRDHGTYMTAEPSNIIWTAKIDGVLLGLRFSGEESFSDSISEAMNSGSFWGSSSEIEFDLSEQPLGGIVTLRGVVRMSLTLSVASEVSMTHTTWSIELTADAVYSGVTDPDEFQVVWGMTCYFQLPEGTPYPDRPSIGARLWGLGHTTQYTDFGEDVPPGGGESNITIEGDLTGGTISARVLIKEQVVGETYVAQISSHVSPLASAGVQQLSYSITIRDNFTGDVVSEFSDVGPAMRNTYPWIQIVDDEFTVIFES